MNSWACPIGFLCFKVFKWLESLGVLRLGIAQLHSLHTLRKVIAFGMLKGRCNRGC